MIWKVKISSVTWKRFLEGTSSSGFDSSQRLVHMFSCISILWLVGGNQNTTTTATTKQQWWYASSVPKPFVSWISSADWRSLSVQLFLNCTQLQQFQRTAILHQVLLEYKPTLDRLPFLSKQCSVSYLTMLVATRKSTDRFQEKPAKQQHPGL